MAIHPFSKSNRGVHIAYCEVPMPLETYLFHTLNEWVDRATYQMEQRILDTISEKQLSKAATDF